MYIRWASNLHSQVRKQAGGWKSTNKGIWKIKKDGKRCCCSVPFAVRCCEQLRF